MIRASAWLFFVVNSCDITVDLQSAVEKTVETPARESIERWVRAALEGAGFTGREVELTVRMVDPEESARLNRTYRHKSGSTNVLSFPFENPPGVVLPLLGDLVICASVVEQQAVGQDKPLMAHWAHMIVHGVLHLLGYDHIEPQQRQEMEMLEISILAGLGYKNPY